MNHFFKGNYIRWWLKNVASHTGKQKIQPSSYNSHCSYPPTVHPQGIQDGEKQDTAPRELKVCISCSVVSDSLQDHGLQPARLLCPWNSGKNTGLGSHSLLQGIFLTQGLNLGLLNCKQIQRVKVNIKKKKMISMSPDSCIFPYTEKLTKFINPRCLVFCN